MLHWLSSVGYRQGVFWSIMISVFSITNDVLMRSLGNFLSIVEISFFRFLLSMLTAVPFMVSRRDWRTILHTQNATLHIWRAIFGAAALGLCCYSVNIMPLAENTAIMFAEPLFFLPCACVWLGERVDGSRWFATGLGFVGLLIFLQPTADIWNVYALVPMTAAFFFAILNVLAKKMVGTDKKATMLFYFGLGTTLIAGIPLPFYWTTPTWTELLWLVLLGAGGNLIQVCLFKAYAAADASALAPFRYVEFAVAALMGYVFFSQIPTLATSVGTLLIVASTCYITLIEIRKEQAA